MGSRLEAILWHQGETDTIGNNPMYQSELDRMIVNMRKDINLDQSKTPFILGAMSEEWVSRIPDRQVFQDIIANTPNRLSYTSLVSSSGLSSNSEPDLIHFSAPAQRSLGLRYFEQFNNQLSNTFMNNE